jgi:hypothetical protein
MGEGDDRSGACVVASAKEYRENAKECLEWAHAARSDREREIFLQIGRTWIEAAERWEAQHDRAGVVHARDWAKL